MDEARREALRRLVREFGLAPRDEVLPLLQEALAHRSWRSEQPADFDNERLEFLGDSAIGYAATRHLFAARPGDPEGVLSKRRASMVSRRTLGRIAAGTSVPELMLLGAGEEASGGRARDSNTGSALEAVVGALCLAYPWEEVEAVVAERIIRPADALADEPAAADMKGVLQEWCQARDGEVPRYEVVESSGPDHLREFVVAASWGGRELGRGRGRRIRDAESEAARAAVERLRAGDEAPGSA